jgi:hypothetical protein
MDERTVKANLFILVILAVIGIPVFLVWWFLIRKKSFGNVPAKNELVLCHAGYCGYCRDFLPEFNKAVPELKTKFPGLKIVTYKHEDDLSLIQKIEPSVTYYPCMRVNGVEFEGPRTAQGVIDFVEKNYLY